MGRNLHGDERKLTGRRITTISLDEKSYEQSKNIGNLSAFVRQKLNDEANKILNLPVDYHNSMHTTIGMCHPHNSSDGYCSICWPYGQPSKSEWFQYTRDWFDARRNGSALPSAPKQSPDRRQITNANQVADQEGSNASMNKGIIRRLWAWFF